ncbi:MAG: hypothetical protein QW035_02205 [Candidatus Anstonellales archaeon]
MDYKAPLSFLVSIAILSLLLPLSLSFLFSSIIALIVHQYPRMKAREKEALIEAELPYFLRQLGTFLSLGITFERALSKSLTPSLAEALKGVEQAKNLPLFLSAKSSSFESLQIRRALAQVVNAYLHGSGKELISLGNEMAGYMLFSLKESSSRITTIGLIYVVALSVVPTFLIILSSVSGYLEFSISPELLWVLLMLAVPCLAFAILMLAIASSPPHPFSPKQVNYYPLLLAPVAVAFPSFSLLWAAMGAFYFLYAFLSAQKAEDYSDLSSALLSASALKGRPAQEILNALSTSKFFSGIKAHSSKDIGRAIREFIRGKEEVVVRVGELLEGAYTAGSDMADACGHSASDILRYLEYRRELISSLGMQKYTILLGALLIPLILYMANSLSLNLGSYLGEQWGPKEELIGAYLVIYSSLSSFYIPSVSMEKKEAAALSAFLFIAPALSFFLLSLLKPF